MPGYSTAGVVVQAGRDSGFRQGERVVGPGFDDDPVGLHRHDRDVHEGDVVRPGGRGKPPVLVRVEPAVLVEVLRRVLVRPPIRVVVSGTGKMGKEVLAAVSADPDD